MKPTYFYAVSDHCSPAGCGVGYPLRPNLRAAVSWPILTTGGYPGPWLPPPPYYQGMARASRPGFDMGTAY